MTKAHRWTAAEDELLAQSRAKGLTLEKVAQQLGVSVTTVYLRRVSLHLVQHKESGDPAKMPQRDPLPAGHPVSWGAIVRGALLERAPVSWPGMAWTR